MRTVQYTWFITDRVKIRVFSKKSSGLSGMCPNATWR